LDANRKVGDGAATLNLRSGASFDGRDLQFGQGSTRFIDRTNDSLVQVYTKDIKSVTIVHRGGGVLEGLMFGALGGLGVGLLAASPLHSGGDEGMGKGYLVLVSIVAGGTGGLVIGAIKGHDYTFILPQDSLKGESQKPE
jgi:hypothetical protein